MLGGILTEYLSWRWCLYVNLVFAGLAVVGGVLLLHQPSRSKPRLDLLGVVLASAGLFCVVYGFSNAASHNWHTPSTWGFLAAGGALLVAFAVWQWRAASPLLPPRVVLDRNRGGAYLAVLIVGAGMFSIFLFLTYYLQQSLGYSPVISRRRLPADDRDGGGLRQPVERRADAARRPQAAGHDRHAARRGRAGVADQDRR